MNRTAKRRFWWISVSVVAVVAAVAILTRGTKDTSNATSEIATSDPMEEAAPETKAYRVRKQRYPVAEDQRHTSQEAEYSPAPRKSYADFMVELNSADTADLEELRGIGKTFARRILKYRNLLGGFRCKGQLMEVYGMTDTLYGKIAPHIVVDTTQVKKIDVNSASIDELKRHPYLDYYQAKAIVRYREKHGPLQSVKELKNISIIDPETYNRIENYINI